MSPVIRKHTGIIIDLVQRRCPSSGDEPLQRGRTCEAFQREGDTQTKLRHLVRGFSYMKETL